MTLLEKLSALASKLPMLADRLETEEATKNALVMPFIAALGYNVFDPTEIVPEFTADLGTKRGEKVDYAIVREDKVRVLFECKKLGGELKQHQHSQLHRYFGVTDARIAVLTDGRRYLLFADLDRPNVMDSRPFLEVDLADLKEEAVNELAKLSKDQFDLDLMLSAAGRLRVLRELRHALRSELEEPTDEFARVLYARACPGSRFTSSAREEFMPLVKRAMLQIVNERVNARLRAAIQTEEKTAQDEAVDAEEPEVEEKGIETTMEELEGFQIVRAIVREVVDPRRVVSRDTKSYFGVLLDDNNRKPICRLHFNRSQKYVGLIAEDKSEERVPISSVDDIFGLAEKLKATAARYD
jgi:hypothetical protein